MLTPLEFKYPSHIVYMLLVIAAAVFLVLSFRKKEKIMASLRWPYQARFKGLRTLLISMGLSLMVVALLGPQVFSGYGEVSKTGMDIYVLIDTSKSMLVSDLKPDRMSVAKKFVGDLLNHLEGDRVGFIPFASGAYIQMPLTDDYELARMFLAVIDTDMMSGGGTNLAAALQLANDSFNRGSGADRVILILSDGEEHETESQSVLKNLTDEQIKIYTVGIGTEKGGLVPVYNNAGDTIVDYMKDETGNPVTSRLHADTLTKLAQNGRGAYYQATLQGTETDALLEALSALNRDTLSTEKVRQFRLLYQYFLAAGILLWVVGWFLPERRKTA